MAKYSPASPLFGRRQNAYEGFVIAAVVIAAIYAGAKVLAPLALAVLLAFVLTPPIQALRRFGLPRAFATVAMVGLLLVAAAIAGAVLTSQVATLSEELPKYQDTLKQKIQDLKSARLASKSMERAGEALTTLQKELAKSNEAAPANAEPVEQLPPARLPPPSSVNTDRRLGANDKDPSPVPVIIRQPEPSALEQIKSVLSVLIEPLASTGLVVVFLVFILLQREDVRNRIIRLLGTKDLQRSTNVLNETGDRLSRLLLAQSVANAVFGAAIGTGLWAIGVPGAILWGILAALMRFVPFVGSIVSGVFPIILAAAVDPGWTTFGLTAALFVVAEVIMGQIVDPLVQGRATGISPLAVIFATVFWTMMWGPLGLILAVPLTLVLVVFGKHIEQLSVFHILLGDEDPLSPAQAFYQRILAGDSDEAADQAETAFKDQPIATYYDSVVAPGLGHAASDLERGKIDIERALRIDESVSEMLEDLETNPDGEPDQTETGKSGSAAVFCIRARTAIDTAGARLLAHLLIVKGGHAEVCTEEELSKLAPSGKCIVAISDFGTANLGSKTNFMIRRIKRRLPGARVVVGFWTAADHNSLPKDIVGAMVVSSFSEALKACAQPETQSDMRAA